MENILEAKASLRNHRGSARKARLVLDMIRGKGVDEAKNILEFSNKRVSKDIQKLLTSAVANAHQVAGRAETKNMTISKAFADDGMIMKRHRMRARGNVNLIRKRYCHITLCLIVIK